jgi:hypothetical protein
VMGILKWWKQAVNFNLTWTSLPDGRLRSM